MSHQSTQSKCSNLIFLSVAILSGCLSPIANSTDSELSTSSVVMSSSTYGNSTYYTSTYDDINTVTGNSENPTEQSNYKLDVGYQGPEFFNCGDGILQDNEECEESIFGSNCLNCKLPRYVFLTWEDYNGANVGGIKNADEICQELANSSDFVSEGTYKAWLSDDISQPFDTFKSNLFDGYYLLPNDEILTEGWIGLGNNELLINVTWSGETKNDISYKVFTNTYSDGTKIADHHCNGWTSDSDKMQAAVGLPNSNWSYDGNIKCSDFAALYCFQVNHSK